ncbi:MAG: 3-oxoacid CoA-transferase subunit A [Acidaminococcales bacterium]|jgi:acetate CoA/acetoacetate CoA-transferase alpha subunit|nr:3-oxoacid CoA-transferase subunit A [Acidaminococcales bacterium]
MAAQIISVVQAADLIFNGASVMVGGFLNAGSPNFILDELCRRPIKDLTVIANDTSFVGKSLGNLVVNKQISRFYVSHIGTNPETGRQMTSGEAEVNLIPQGTLAERIRCAGFGLGGVLTPTGVGTPVQADKQIVEVEGKKYLMELPLYADIAIIKAYKADKIGNLIYRGAARNFNPLMATAAKLVIAETEHIVETGEISPDEVITPSIFVDYLVMGKN